MEVQSHGFTWQNDILLNTYKVSSEDLVSMNYTQKDDLPGSFNTLNPGVALSIKTTGSPNSVCMGDALRVYDSVFSTTPLHMVVLTYSQQGPIKHLESVIEVNLTNSGPLLFGDLCRSDIEQLDRAIKTLPSGKLTEDQRNEYKTIQETLSKSMTGLVLNPKIDSKHQRRLQCSFHHFLAFVNANPKRVIARCGSDGLFRGAQLQTQLTSGRRQLRSGSEHD